MPNVANDLHTKIDSLPSRLKAEINDYVDFLVCKRCDSHSFRKRGSSPQLKRAGVGGAPTKEGKRKPIIKADKFGKSLLAMRNLCAGIPRSVSLVNELSKEREKEARNE